MARYISSDKDLRAELKSWTGGMGRKKLLHLEPPWPSYNFDRCILTPRVAMRIRMPKCKVQGLVQESAHHGCALVLHSFVENGLNSHALPCLSLVSAGHLIGDVVITFQSLSN